MINQNRATGRTHRLALKACLLASEGKKVTFIYGPHNEMHEIFRQLSYISIPANAIYSKMAQTVRYPGGGLIELVPAHACHRGRHYSIIMMDELKGLTWPQIESLNKQLGNPHITT
jgi:hypothetical protein